MSNAIIVDSLNERGVSITHQQLVSPTAQSTLSIYSGCLRLLTGLTAESLQEPVEDSLIATDEPNLVCSLDSSVLLFSDLMSQDIYDRAFGTNILVYHMYAFLRVLIVLKVSECMQITFGDCSKGPRL